MVGSDVLFLLKRTSITAWLDIKWWNDATHNMGSKIPFQAWQLINGCRWTKALDMDCCEGYFPNPFPQLIEKVRLQCYNKRCCWSTKLRLWQRWPAPYNTHICLRMGLPMPCAAISAEAREGSMCLSDPKLSALTSHVQKGNKWNGAATFAKSWTFVQCFGLQHRKFFGKCVVQLFGGARYGFSWEAQQTFDSHSWKVFLGETTMILSSSSRWWWFQIFFIFTSIWGRFPFWLKFFKGVATTNQTVKLEDFGWNNHD